MEHNPKIKINILSVYLAFTVLTTRVLKKYILLCKCRTVWLDFSFSVYKQFLFPSFGFFFRFNKLIHFYFSFHNITDHKNIEHREMGMKKEKKKLK